MKKYKYTGPTQYFKINGTDSDQVLIESGAIVSGKISEQYVNGEVKQGFYYGKSQKRAFLNKSDLQAIEEKKCCPIILVAAGIVISYLILKK